MLENKMKNNPDYHRLKLKMSDENVWNKKNVHVHVHVRVHMSMEYLKSLYLIYIINDISESSMFSFLFSVDQYCRIFRKNILDST